MMRETLQDSALGMVFRISRVFGVAPVTFSKYNVHVSRPLMMSSILFFTIINCLLLLGLVFDFEAPPSRRIRVESNSSSLVWIANLTNVMLINAVGVYFAPSRIKCINKVLASVNKMKRKIEENKIYNKIGNSDKKLRWTCTFLIAYIFGLVIGDILEYAEATLKEDKEVKVVILYTGFYYEYLCFTLYEYQFILVATEVRNVLTMITNGLEEFLITQSPDQPRKKNQFPVSENYFQTGGNFININRFVDTLPAGVLFPEKYPGKGEIFVHDLALVFGDACDLIRDVNSGFGLQLLLILMSFFLELIVTPYYLMTDLTNTSDHDASYIILQVFWVVYHLTSMFFVIEPAYLTQLEIEKIEYVLSRCVREVKPHEDVYSDLEMFRRQLAFTRPTYSPLGVCILSRQLCVSILGSVTTYLVIILQFRAYES